LRSVTAITGAVPHATHSVGVHRRFGVNNLQYSVHGEQREITPRERGAEKMRGRHDGPTIRRRQQRDCKGGS